MNQTHTDRLNRVLGAAIVIQDVTERLIIAARCLRDRASGIGPDDDAMLTRYVDQLRTSIRDLDR
jgi:hypothetical protein